MRAPASADTPPIKRDMCLGRCLHGVLDPALRAGRLQSRDYPNQPRCHTPITGPLHRPRVLLDPQIDDVDAPVSASGSPLRANRRVGRPERSRDSAR
jgi:hypothetical protein